MFFVKDLEDNAVDVNLIAVGNLKSAPHTLGLVLWVSGH